MIGHIRRAAVSKATRLVLSAVAAVAVLLGASPGAAGAAYTDPTQLQTEGCYYIHSSQDKEYVLEVRQASPRLDAGVSVSKKLGNSDPFKRAGSWAPHQVWVMARDGYLVSKLNGFALSLSGGVATAGTPAVVNPNYFGRRMAQWAIGADGAIAERQSGLVLEADFASPGAPVTVSSKQYAANQRWLFAAVPDCYVDPSKYNQPLTHGADLDGKRVLTGSGDPDDSGIGQFNYRRTSTGGSLYINIQYTATLNLNNARLVHYPTARFPFELFHQRYLPPPTNRTITTTWSLDARMAQVIERAPEEVYVMLGTAEYPYSYTAGTSAICGNLYWRPLQSGGGSDL